MSNTTCISVQCTYLLSTMRLPGGFESMNFDVISANIWLIYGIHKQIILPSRMWFVNPNKIANISMKTFSCMRPSKMVSISAMLSFILFIPLFYYWKEVLSDYYFIWTDDGSILMNITNLYNKQSSVEQLLLWAVKKCFDDAGAAWALKYETYFRYFYLNTK